MLFVLYKNLGFEFPIGAKTCIFITLHFHKKLIENFYSNLKSQGIQFSFWKILLNRREIKQNLKIEISYTLQATRCWQSLPKSRGGEILQSRVTTSTCLILTFASGSYSFFFENLVKSQRNKTKFENQN